MTERLIHSKYLFQNNRHSADFTSPIIVACEIKTPENLGNIIRLAHNISSQKVLFVDIDKEIRISKIKKTASSSYNSVNWEFCSSKELLDKIPKDYSWTAIETSSDSINIYQTNLPKRIAFFVGNEVSGIRNDILDKCERIVHIPIFGENTSLNVTHALAISLFEWQRQILTSQSFNR